MDQRRGFTLVELLVVIAIVAVLGTAVVLVLNPAELVKQSRDSARLSDLSAINRAFALLEADQPEFFEGAANTIYVSIPDSSVSCANLGLTVIPAGWSYACVSESGHRNTDGTGWIPVDFTAASYGSPFAALPTDPINSTSSGSYYTYVAGGSYKLSALFESEKYAVYSQNDGGLDASVYEMGTNMNLPSAHGLVGYWKFNETSGSSALDSSGFGHTVFVGGSGPSWQSSGCKAGGCLRISGGFGCSNCSNVYAPDSSALDLNTQGTIAGWIQVNGYDGNGNPSYILFTKAGAYNFTINDWGGSSIFNAGVSGAPGSVSQHVWRHVAATFNNGTIKYYVNGALFGTAVGASPLPNSASVLKFGAREAYTLNGMIDEVRVYNRVLSDDEISLLYSSS